MSGLQFMLQHTVRNPEQPPVVEDHYYNLSYKARPITLNPAPKTVTQVSFQQKARELAMALKSPDTLAAFSDGLRAIVAEYALSLTVT